DAFTGGLFQDMGMLAMATALGERYAASVTGGRHCHLPPKEHEAFGFDHAAAGGALAERWRLPAQTAECVRRHHDPESAAPEHRPVVCCVALGSRLACELLASQPERRMAGLSPMCDAWFGPGAVD